MLCKCVYACIYSNFVFRIDPRDPDLLKYNKVTLPAFYGLLRQLCEQSIALRSNGDEKVFDFACALMRHNNVMWALEHVAVSHNQQEYARVCAI
jgi:hypothetical protein